MWAASQSLLLPLTHVCKVEPESVPGAADDGERVDPVDFSPCFVLQQSLWILLPLGEQREKERDATELQVWFWGESRRPFRVPITSGFDPGCVKTRPASISLDVGSPPFEAFDRFFCRAGLSGAVAKPYATRFRPVSVFTRPRP